MKKILLLTLAAGLLSASPLMAVDLYITGSTAFRANVHDACLKLFDTLPSDGTTLRYGGTATGGNGAHNNGNGQWTMTGTVSGKVSALGSTPLTIHALFTGSVQGNQTVVQSTKLTFLDTSGNPVTNTPTIAFSDSSSAASPFPATGSFNEEPICVQPFVMCRSAGGGGVTNITGVNWEQLKYAIQAGRIPLSAWTYKPADHNTFVYLVERTKDSGTRRTEFAQELDGFNQGATVYNYDVTNNFFYKATNTVAGPVGAAQGLTNSIGVVGAPGNGNANLNWGSGYVGGGDIKTELGIANPANQAIAYLSIADAKGIISGSASNWSQVIPFDGAWPTAAGAGIVGNTGTNDYSPITEGLYYAWGYEVVVYPVVEPTTLPGGDQNLSLAQLGDQNTSGTILGVLDHAAPGAPLVGSIENEIELSKTTGATAIRLSDMVSSRSSVGGTIAP